MKNVSRIVCLLLLSNNLIAQEAEPKLVSSFLAAEFHGGFSGFDAGETNHVLKAASLPALKTSPNFNYGYSIYFFQREVIYTDVSYDVTNLSMETNAVRVEQKQSNTDVNLHYLLFHKKRHFISPSFGLGWMTKSFTIINKQPSQTFLQTLGTKGNETLFEASNLFYLNLKVSYDVLLDKKGLLYLGFRGGYRLGFKRKAWEIQENMLTDSPKDKANSYFVHLALGMNLIPNEKYKSKASK